jgi:hypothetical protein
MQSVGDLVEYALENSSQNIKFKASVPVPFSSFKGEAGGFVGDVHILNVRFKNCLLAMTQNLPSVLQNGVLIVVEY